MAQSICDDPDFVEVSSKGLSERRWRDLLDQRYGPIRVLARAYDTDERYVARFILLPFLPPEVTRTILEGHQHPEFTLHRVLRS